MYVAVQLAMMAMLLGVGGDATSTTPGTVATPAPSGVVLVYEVECDTTAYSTTDCPSHDLAVTRVASTGSSSSDWPDSYIAVVILLFLLVLVVLGLVIAVYVRQQQGYSQVAPEDYSQQPGGYSYAEAGRARKTIGVELVRACGPGDVL